ncbi:hypothetical protein Droror1_Dr00000745 [Drosera rotundifolia]
MSVLSFRGFPNIPNCCLSWDPCKYSNLDRFSFNWVFGGSRFDSKVTALGINGSNSCQLSLSRRPEKGFELTGLEVVDSRVEYALICKVVKEEKALVEVEEMKGLEPSGDMSVNGDMICEKKRVVVDRSEIRVHYLEERDEKVLSGRILSLCRANKMRSALEFFKSMKRLKLRPELHACNALLSGLTRNNMVEHASHVFEFMKRNEVISGHSYSLVVKAVASGYGSAAALKMFWEWENESESKNGFDVIVYNTMLSICGRENDWGEMEKVWNAMRLNGQFGTMVTYRVLVCTFVRCGRSELAIEAYNEMRHFGLTPTDDAMHAIIGAYANEGNADLALGVFQDMLDNDLKPSLVACNTVVNLLGKAGNVKAAFWVHDIMQGLGLSPDSYTWNGLLGAYYHANYYADALRLYDTIDRGRSVVMNEQLCLVALKICRKLGLWEKAIQILCKMEESGIHVSNVSFNLVIVACEAAEKPEIAIQVYEHMIHVRCTPDTYTHLSLIRCCILGSMWPELVKILTATPPNASAYNAVIHGLCFKGEIQLAKKMYVKMKDLGLAPNRKTRALMLQFQQEKAGEKRMRMSPF